MLSNRSSEVSTQFQYHYNFEKDEIPTEDKPSEDKLNFFQENISSTLTSEKIAHRRKNM